MKSAAGFPSHSSTLSVSSPGVFGDIVRHPDNGCDAMRAKVRVEHECQRMDVGALVEFLRTKPPPPNNNNYNYMNNNHVSEQDSMSRSRFRPKWLARFRRRGPSAPEPERKTIKTPVAGTTVGGHRHIHISIPPEYMPFAPEVHSQYPVYPPAGGKRPEARRAPRPHIRTVANDDGGTVVTVPRAVAGDSGTLSAAHNIVPRSDLSNLALGAARHPSDALPVIKTMESNVQQQQQHKGRQQVELPVMSPLDKLASRAKLARESIQHAATTDTAVVTTRPSLPTNYGRVHVDVRRYTAGGPAQRY